MNTETGRKGVGAGTEPLGAEPLGTGTEPGAVHRVVISGQHNRYLIKKVIGDKPVRQKNTLGDVPHSIQLQQVNKLYLAHKDGTLSVYATEIQKKIMGYKKQDSLKNFESGAAADALITLDSVLEKLVAAKLQCFYCRGPMVILYSTPRESTQWTLDRLDNSLNHSSANTVVACLACNLSRRSMPVAKFQFTKNLRLTKLTEN